MVYIIRIAVTFYDFLRYIQDVNSIWQVMDRPHWVELVMDKVRNFFILTI